MTAVKTYPSRVNRALSFYNQSSIYFGIGKPDAWSASDYPDPTNVPTDMENNPPSPDPYATSLTSPIAYRKADKIYLVVPFSGGTVGTSDIIITYPDSQWKVVSDIDAIADLAYYVYVETTIQAGDIADTDYRQVGLFSGLTRNSTVSSSQIVLLPTDIQTTGVMELIDNRKMSTINSNAQETLSYVIKF